MISDPSAGQRPAPHELVRVERGGDSRSMNLSGLSGAETRAPMVIETDNGYRNR
jgi:hypothetical protein